MKTYTMKTEIPERVITDMAGNVILTLYGNPVEQLIALLAVKKQLTEVEKELRPIVKERAMKDGEQNGWPVRYGDGVVLKCSPEKPLYLNEDVAEELIVEFPAAVDIKTSYKIRHQYINQLMKKRDDGRDHVRAFITANHLDQPNNVKMELEGV